ncbi:MAG: polyprenyl synthetase family protein [Clostridia bacterium]|nr:polyprenyl synthetase family protein [Clostridia bacterium]
MKLSEKQSQIIFRVNERLDRLFENDSPELLRESMKYSIKAGGKRLRPVLNILAAELFTDDTEENLDIACAIEMIHTYSLIHDDLPALDNDSLRRGKLTNHMVYGEAQAILAGDGLLSFAFEVMLDNAMRHKGNLEREMRAIKTIANAAGVEGMVAGQVMDVSLENTSYGYDTLSYIHTHKTADMIVGALLSGALLHTDDEEALRALRTYGEHLGHTFQIIDDILDITAGEELGKSRGKDVMEGKITYPSLFGIVKSFEMAKERTKKAIEALSVFGDKACYLKEIAEIMLNRSL